MAIGDEEIKKEVVDQLYWDDKVDASHIHVDVEKAKVILSGTVKSHTESQSAKFDAEIVPGVSSVRNNLVISPSVEETVPDEELRIKARKMLLANDDDVGVADIEVSAKDGIITLNGCVDSGWKRIKARQIIKGLVGTIDVVDNLAVAPSGRIEDKVIAEEIISQLKNNKKVSAQDINVIVAYGNVELTGNVCCRSDIQWIEDTASLVIGVKKIKNDLEVYKQYREK